MSVTRDEGAIRLVGDCGVADAEPLAAHCAAAPNLPVDVTRAGHLHTAVVQALVRHAPQILGPSTDAFTETWLLPALERVRTPESANDV